MRLNCGPLTVSRMAAREVLQSEWQIVDVDEVLYRLRNQFDSSFLRVQIMLCFKYETTELREQYCSSLKRSSVSWSFKILGRTCQFSNYNNIEASLNKRRPSMSSSLQLMLFSALDSWICNRIGTNNSLYTWQQCLMHNRKPIFLLKACVFILFALRSTRLT